MRRASQETYGNGLSHAQSTLRTLTSGGDGTVAIASLGQRPVDVVCPDLGAA